MRQICRPRWLRIARGAQPPVVVCRGPGPMRQLAKDQAPAKGEGRERRGSVGGQGRGLLIPSGGGAMGARGAPAPGTMPGRWDIDPRRAAESALAWPAAGLADRLRGPRRLCSDLGRYMWGADLCFPTCAAPDPVLSATTACSPRSGLVPGGPGPCWSGRRRHPRRGPAGGYGRARVARFPYTLNIVYFLVAGWTFAASRIRRVPPLRTREHRHA
jgi:hypothetical protein